MGRHPATIACTDFDFTLQRIFNNRQFVINRTLLHYVRLMERAVRLSSVCNVVAPEAES